MSGYTHALFMDEAGAAQGNMKAIDSLWVIAGVLIPFAKTRVAWDRVQYLLSEHFHPSVRELKGNWSGKRLLPGRTVAGFAEDFGKLLHDADAVAWVAATQKNAGHLNFKYRHPKEIARQLMLERVASDLENERLPGARVMLVWDISEQQELQEFSGFVRDFENGHTGDPRPPSMAGALLGGVSHDWGGLQMADIMAHYALHWIGREPMRVRKGYWRREQQDWKEMRELGITPPRPGPLEKVSDAKADAFAKHLKPMLMRSPGGQISGYGLKTW